MFDWVIPLIVMAVLVFPVIAIVALVKASTLSGIVRRLDLRLAALERDFALRSAAPTPPAAAPAPPETVAPTKPVTPPPLPPEPPPPPPTSVPLSSAPSLPPAAAPPRIGFEEKFGTRWVVWVGGVALALGGIFLVRYTIQQGLIGPGVRIVLGALLALALVAVGEWARRGERSVGASRPAVGAYSEHADRGRHHGGLCDGVRGLCALRLPAAGCRLRSARRRRAADLGGRAASRPSARRPRRGRRLSWRRCWSASRQAGLLGALHLYRRRHRGRICAGARAAVALARGHRDGARRVMDAAGNRSSLRSPRLARTCSTRLRALRLPRPFWSAACCTVRQPSPARSTALSAARAVGLSPGRGGFWCWRADHDPVALTAFVVLTVATVAIAWRTEAATGAVPVSRNPRDGGDGPTGRCR